MTPLYAASSEGMDRIVEFLLADLRVDPNLGDSDGCTPLFTAISMGMDRCVEVLLSDPRIDPNIANTVNGFAPLHIAADLGHDRYVERFLADSRVDPNMRDFKGNTPLSIAAQHGMDGCVELFLADKRVDVCEGGVDGQPPLISACVQLMESMDQVGAPGGKDPARVLVLMLKSRRIPKHNLKESITHLFKYMPNRRQIHNAEVGGEPLTPQQKMTRLFPPRPPVSAEGRLPLVRPLPQAHPRRGPQPLWRM